MGILVLFCVKFLIPFFKTYEPRKLTPVDRAPNGHGFDSPSGTHFNIPHPEWRSWQMNISFSSILHSTIILYLKRTGIFKTQGPFKLCDITKVERGQELSLSIIISILLLSWSIQSRSEILAFYIISFEIGSFLVTSKTLSLQLILFFIMN